MNAQQLREKFINFFVSKQHSKINSAPLVPENDPTILFTTAGMHPLVPFLLGEKHPAGKLLVNAQKCLRTDDIDEVGDDTHLTFFEMLGNWSLGEYFKKEAIELSWEFLTKELKFDKDKIAVSCFAGDKDAPADQESAKIWQSLGIAKDKIAYLPKKNNWWGPAGNTGPCGPDTEMFYWPGASKPPKKFDPQDNPPTGGWVEIWNDVFMQYNKTADGKYLPLAQKNVDTGMGLERVLAILEHKSNVFETELFAPIISIIKKMSKKYNDRSAKIVADHLKASVFIIADGIEPSNLDQGYILRRLIRRAIRYANLLEIFKADYFKPIVKTIAKIYQGTYLEIKDTQKIVAVLQQEAEKFETALKLGEKEFARASRALKEHNQDTISGRLAFRLYESFGFPMEMTEELAREEGLQIDKSGFDKEFQKHQLRSRAGAEQKFKGGLADNSYAVTKFHSAAHLLHAALRKILGEHIAQKGSNITGERLRFDFSHKDKLTQEQIEQVENLVNEQIKLKLPVIMQEMDLKDAKLSGALGFFESKYGKIVKVYTIGRSDRDYFSREICGGPHIKNTAELGHFKITSEKSSSSGVRRIKAIFE